MANFTNEYPYENATQISYNQAGVTYNDVRYTYDGKAITIWTNETESA